MKAALSKRLRALLARAFTLLEILIAIVILVVGITGIIALFPTAIKSGNQTVVDSYASLITQSVVDAINVGVRESRYRYSTPSGEDWEYFIFDHDGVLDNIDGPGIIPEDYTTVFNKDFCILLPRGDANNSDQDREMILHFPTPPNKVGARQFPALGAANSLNDEDLTRDLRATVRDGPTGNKLFETRRVFHLGRDRTQPPAPPSNLPPVRDEFLGAQVGTSERGVVDPYPQYSFSFSITRAKIDTNPPRGILDGADLFSDSLYEVKIKVFRNFNPQVGPQGVTSDAAGLIPRNNLPIHEFVTFVST